MPRKTIQEVTREIRRTPGGYTFSAFLLVIVWELLKDRLSSWTNAQIDARGNVLLVYAHKFLGWTEQNPAEFVWSIVGLYILAILIRATLVRSPNRSPEVIPVNTRIHTPPESKAPDMAVSQSRPPRGTGAGKLIIERQKSNLATEERVIASVSPSYLTGLFEGHTKIQGKKLLEAYLGKWMKVVGNVSDVYGEARVAMDAHAERRISVFLDFEGSAKPYDYIPALRRNEEIAVLGRIERADGTCVWLVDCELIDS